jgi:exosortase/archaeosortase family protein
MAYAELIYRSWGRRAGFVLALLALAVIGNALRVFLIIAIAHATDNVGDIADDHILYGWAFFSVLLLGAMAIGQRFRQDGAPPRSAPVAAIPAGSSWSIPTATIFAALLAMTGPALVWGLRSDGVRPAVALPPLSCGPTDAAAATSGPGWPSHVGQVDSLAAIDCGPVHFVMAGLDRPVRLGKLVGVERWVAASEGWSRVGRRVTTQNIGGHVIPVQADLELRGNRKRLIWSLFWAGDGWRVPGWPVALADLKMDLLGRRRAILVLAATSADDGEEAAEAVLRTFLDGQPLDLDTPFRRTR